MNTSSTPTACANMITAAQNFLTLLSPYDQVGLIDIRHHGVPDGRAHHKPHAN
jgi:hypothetical protein